MAAVVSTGVCDCDKVHKVIFTGGVHEEITNALIHGVCRAAKVQSDESRDAMGDLNGKY
jgi:hypothetical protein